MAQVTTAVAELGNQCGVERMMLATGGEPIRMIGVMCTVSDTTTMPVVGFG